MGVYLDNASTSFPKPKEVVDAVFQALTLNYGSLHRTHSGDALALERAVYETRSLVASFFNFNAIDHVVFTKNITESINLLLLGFLREGDKVVTTSLEHNAVMRPLEFLRKEKGIAYNVVTLNELGDIDYRALEAQLAKKPKLMISTCASNVTGDLVDIAEIGRLCKKYEVAYLLDTAQVAGVMPIDMVQLGVSFLAFTGHKALRAPQGIGGLLINPKFKDDIFPLIYGGTGSLSSSLDQPICMPDRFESGTPNTPGILGLNAAIKYLNRIDLSDVRRHEILLMERFQDGLKAIRGIRTIGKENPGKRMGILSLDCDYHDNSEVANRLDKEYGVITRVGLHCAPMAHRAYGTFPKGTIRFSLSSETTEEEIDWTLKALKEVLESGP